MPRFWALIENDRGLDLFKLQLLVFTVLTATYVAARVVRQSAFPELENEFLLLMGVSNSLYVGSKVAQASPFAVAEARKVELDLLRLQVVDLTKLAESLAADDAKLAKEVAEAAGDQALAQKKKDEQAIVDKKLVDTRDALAKARSASEAKEKEYQKVLDALKTPPAAAGN